MPFLDFVVMMGHAGRQSGTFICAMRCSVPAQDGNKHRFRREERPHG